MFNAVCKIPMQFLILLLGVLVFVFYQFEQPPIFFNQVAWKYQARLGHGEQLHALEGDFAQAFSQKRQQLNQWLAARHSGNPAAEAIARTAALAAHERSEVVRSEAKKAMAGAKSNDADYVFITFILEHLPHGVIGLLVSVFFAAALSSKAGELNALGSTTIVDFYRHIIKRGKDDAHYVLASKCFTVFWGLVAIAFALFANMTENLIQASNIVGSIFYGVVLGLFLVAFFLKRVGGTAVFWAALAAQVLVFILYFSLTISYLWYNVIGCAACVLLSLALQIMLGPTRQITTIAR
jgi:Na+(H+)/acetate symporter ActP